jgi:Cdc6-like AAA superfamily ATPase
MDFGNEEAQRFGQCDLVGDALLTGLDGKKFYRGVRTHNVVVNVGDLVRVTLDDDEVGYGQVLGIYDEDEEEGGEGEGVHAEVRWFITPEELDSKRQKVLGETLENELIETEDVDDIGAGAIAEVISVVQGPKSGGRSNGSNSGSSNSKKAKTARVGGGDNEDAALPVYPCRYMASAGSNALQVILVKSMFTRGMQYSHYGHAYVEYIAKHSGMGGGIGGGSGKEGVDIYSDAIRKLHISVLPERLPCRQTERDKIYSELRNAIVERTMTKPIFISGMPGTGKTATVLATVQELRKEAAKGDIPEFDFVEINCLRLQAPSEAYTVAWRGMTGNVTSAKSASEKLRSLFSNAGLNAHLTKERSVTICLIDELDFLVTRDEEILFNFFTWPIMTDSLFVVIGISNQMDLPERLTTRVASRVQMERLRFQPYSHDQIKEILEGRLDDLGPKIFEKGSMEFVSRRASTVAGDLRAALKICQRTIELYRDQEQRLAKASAATTAASSSSSAAVAPSVPVVAAPEKKTIMALVNAAANEYRMSPMMATVTKACTLDKAILIAACKHFRVTGDSDISPDVLWERLEDLLYAMRNTPNFTLLSPPQAIFDEAMCRLLDQGMLKRTGSKLINCSSSARQGFFGIRLEVTDIAIALKDDPLVRFLK